MKEDVDFKKTEGKIFADNDSFESTIKTCPHCGGKIHYQNTKCPICNKHIVCSQSRISSLVEENTGDKTRCHKCGVEVGSESKYCPKCGNEIEPKDYHFTYRCNYLQGFDYRPERKRSSVSPFSIITILLGIFILMSFGFSFYDISFVDISGFELLEQIFKNFEIANPLSIGMFIFYAFISSLSACIFSLVSIGGSQRLLGSGLFSILGIVCMLIATNFDFDEMGMGFFVYIIEGVANVVMSFIGYSKRYDYF